VGEPIENRQNENPVTKRQVIAIAAALLVVLPLVGLSAVGGGKGLGSAKASAASTRGTSYAEVRASFENWYSTVLAYIDGNASLSDLQSASDDSVQVANHYEGPIDSPCTRAVAAYDDGIAEYSYDLGGPPHEAYARAAQAGQHMEETCD
jgi:hypothetical protein